MTTLSVIGILSFLAAVGIFAMRRQDDPSVLSTRRSANNGVVYRDFEERGWLGGATDHQVSGEDDKFDTV